MLVLFTSSVSFTTKYTFQKYDLSSSFKYQNVDKLFTYFHGGILSLNKLCDAN